MKMQQIAELVNSVTSEALGEENLLQEDLSNVVSVGDAIQNVMGLDNYVKKLCDRIGRTIFVDRVYSGEGGILSAIYRDGFEFGSIIQKVNTILPEAMENEDWQLENLQSYDYSIFYQPNVSVKYFNDKTTWSIRLSFTEEQVKSAFNGPTELSSFIAMLHNSINNSMTVKEEELARRALNNLASHVIATNDGVTYVKLLTLYNATLPDSATPLDADEFMRTPEAVKFAIAYFYRIIDRLGTMSTLFNLEHTPKFTSKDRLSFIVLSDFETNIRAFVDSDTWHYEKIALPEHKTVTYWQGSGDDYAFSNVSKIDVKNSYGDTVNVSNIVAIAFDRDAVAVCNTKRKTDVAYNPAASFYTEFHKFETQMFTDSQENMVVFALN